MSSWCSRGEQERGKQQYRQRQEAHSISIYTKHLAGNVVIYIHAKKYHSIVDQDVHRATEVGSGELLALIGVAAIAGFNYVSTLSFRLIILLQHYRHHPVSRLQIYPPIPSLLFPNFDTPPTYPPIHLYDHSAILSQKGIARSEHDYIDHLLHLTLVRHGQSCGSYTSSIPVQWYWSGWW